MRSTGLAVVTLLALLAAGCAGGREFTAEEFVAEVNARGASLVLGEPLETARDDTEVFAIGLGSGSGAGAGSLTVTEDAEAGLDELERCERAASLLCFRANNVVVLAEEFDRRSLRDLRRALEEMARE